MNEGKPAEIAEKMVQGRIGKFYGEICLIEQPFVKNPDSKVSDLLNTKGAKVVEFARFEKGEGLEKIKNFLLAIKLAIEHFLRIQKVRFL